MGQRQKGDRMGLFLRRSRMTLNELRDVHSPSLSLCLSLSLFFLFSPLFATRQIYEGVSVCRSVCRPVGPLNFERHSITHSEAIRRCMLISVHGPCFVVQSDSVVHWIMSDGDDHYIWGNAELSIFLSLFFSIPPPPSWLGVPASCLLGPPSWL